MISEFDKLNRQIQKITATEKVPKVYVKTVAELEDKMNEDIARQKVTPKKFNATNAKGLNAMKQKIKRNNRDYADEIGKYRDDKMDYMMSDEEEEIAPVEKPKKVKAADRFEDVDDDKGFLMVDKQGKALQYTPESIFKHLRSIIESRGRKNTDRGEQIRIMERLLEVAKTPYQKIRVLLTIVSTRFDLVTGSTTGFMSQEQWKLYVAQIRSPYQYI